MLFLPIIAELAGEAALKSMPQKVSVEHIDASWLGMLVGGVSTGLAVAILFFFVGWMLLKYGAVKIGGAAVEIIPSSPEHCLMSPELCPAHGEEKQRSLANERQLTDLYQKYGLVTTGMTNMAVDIAGIKSDVGYIKTGVSELQSRRGGR